jgi:predicted O-linked N-acetylglucosamine transferase (SPINDLY family)
MSTGGGGFRPILANPDPERRLRVGYLSHDVRDHCVSHFMRPILAHHNREKFGADPVFIHRCGGRDHSRAGGGRGGSSWTRPGWRTACSTSGFTRTGRHPRRPLRSHIGLAGGDHGAPAAPVQVTYLGYPNTTGIKAVGYRIVDEVTDPAGDEAFATEKLVRLPGCFLCYQPPVEAPEVAPPRPERRDM